MRALCKLFIISAIGAVIASCARPYDPDLDPPGSLLVVEGLLTDNMNLSEIKLSRTFGFGEMKMNDPEEGALVWVTDQDEQMLPFVEVYAGSYLPNGWDPVVGGTYTLHIETSDGSSYVSTPQTMQPPVRIDSIYGKKAVHQVMETNLEGGTYIRSFSGTDYFVDITGVAGETPRFRMEVVIVVLYVWETGGSSTHTYYAWKKLFTPGRLNINSADFEPDADTIRNHLLVFTADDRISNRLDIDEYLQYHALIVRQFSLTDEAAAFYQGMKEQLESEGRLFDPIAVQLVGNVKCVSDPGQPVLGLFDVSSVHSDSYINYSPSYMEEKWIHPVVSLENIPTNGYLVDERPYFWPGAN